MKLLKFSILLLFFFTVLIADNSNLPPTRWPDTGYIRHYEIDGNWTISSAYGPRYLFNNYDFHRGMDLGNVKEDDDVYAHADGTIKAIMELAEGYGYWMIIEHHYDYNEIRNYFSGYMHIKDPAEDPINLEEGNEVYRGDVIGKGYSNHLHFSLLTLAYEDYGTNRERAAFHPIAYLYHEDDPDGYSVENYRRDGSDIKFTLKVPGFILDCNLLVLQHLNSAGLPIEEIRFSYREWGKDHANHASGLDDSTPDLDGDGDADMFIQPSSFSRFAKDPQSIDFTFYLEEEILDENSLFLGIYDDDHIAMYTNETSVDPGFVSTKKISEIPQEIKIDTYPNPVNDQLAINLTLPTNESITQLTIFDIRGRIVYKNIIPPCNKNDKKIVWNFSNIDGKKMSSGTYLIRVENREQIETKKVTLLK